MAKKEMIDTPVFGLAFRAWGAFPVRRFEADLGALRRAVDVVRSGEALMMFPEGTRSRTGKLTKGHPGTALVAYRSGAPVLPVAITGTEGIRWPWFVLKLRGVARIRVVIGEPFVLPPVARIDAAAAQQGTDEIMRHIAALLPPEYRGVYAETPARGMP
jgi:1-acyl-sn-glycerol-3-phosphate acyltransferase